jgi:siroheme synthase (precorrin-2 oxidase/ferrochelatase)
MPIITTSDAHKLIVEFFAPRFLSHGGVDLQVSISTNDLEFVFLRHRLQDKLETGLESHAP